MTHTNTRFIAFKLLNICLEDKISLKVLFANEPSFLRLPTEERAYVRYLLDTTFRHWGCITAVLAELTRPETKNNKPLWHALCLGQAQFWYTNTKAHAVVNETVELVKSHISPKLSGLVNAVLRKTMREEKTLSVIAHNPAHVLSPHWSKRWGKQLDAETLNQIGSAALMRPAFDITVRENPEAWAKKLDGQVLPTGSIRLSNVSNLTEMPGFKDGDWWVQDLAAALPVKVMGNLKDKKVLDVCAAPGGKTAQLVSAGATVSALEISRNRIKILLENMRRLKLRCEPIQADATKWENTQQFDSILLDGPCSATGNLRKHPDALWLKKSDNLKSLIQIQQDLLNAAADWVKPDGTLIYCTCSIDKAENQDQIALFLKKHPEFTRDAIKPEEVLGLEQCLNDRGDFLSLPHHYVKEWGGISGFYIARLKKTSST